MPPLLGHLGQRWPARRAQDPGGVMARRHGERRADLALRGDERPARLARRGLLPRIPKALPPLWGHGGGPGAMEPTASARLRGRARPPPGPTRRPARPRLRPAGHDGGERGSVQGGRARGGGRPGPTLPRPLGGEPPHAAGQDAGRAQGALGPARGPRAGWHEPGGALRGSAGARQRGRDRRGGCWAPQARASGQAEAWALGQRMPAEPPRGEEHWQNSQPVTW